MGNGYFVTPQQVSLKVALLNKIRGLKDIYLLVMLRHTTLTTSAMLAA